MSILHSYDIPSDKKGRLANRSIDDDLATATGAYRSALLLIKGVRDYRAEVHRTIDAGKPAHFIPDGPTEVGVRTKRRIAQDCLREVVLSNYGKCALCGVLESDLLVCSHIVPWALDEKNRLNPSNAICFCAWHDRLFDRGYFSLDTQMNIVISDCCPTYVRRQLQELKFNAPLKGAPNPIFIECHRRRILK